MNVASQCPHLECKEVIQSGNLVGQFTPENQFWIKQFAEALSEAVDPYQCWREFIQSSEAQQNLKPSSLPILLKPFVDRSEDSVIKGKHFFSSLLGAFNDKTEERVNADGMPLDFFTYTEQQAGARLTLKTQLRFSERNNQFYNYELEILSAIFNINIVVVADGYEPVIIGPSTKKEVDQATDNGSYDSGDTKEATESDSRPYLLLHYENLGTDFVYYEVSLPVHVNLQNFLSEIQGKVFHSTPETRALSDEESTSDRRSSCVARCDEKLDSPEPPQIDTDSPSRRSSYVAVDDKRDGSPVRPPVHALWHGPSFGENSPSRRSSYVAVEDKGENSPVRSPVHALWHGPSLGGLRLIKENIPHDGNCFFTSIVGALKYLQISNPPEDQQAVRDAVASWAAESKDIALYLESRTLEQYQASVKSNLWGGELEFRAIAEIYQIPVVMIKIGSLPTLYRPGLSELSTWSGPAIFIEYQASHFNLLNLTNPDMSSAWFNQIKQQKVSVALIENWLQKTNLLGSSQELNSTSGVSLFSSGSSAAKSQEDREVTTFKSRSREVSGV